MEYHKGLGLWERLEKICEEKGTKPFSLVRKGVRKSTIDSIKRGSDIAVSSAHEVAKALGVTIEELLTGEEPQVKEEVPGYGYSREEREYAVKLVEIMRTKMNGTVQAIKQNIDAFLTTPDKEAEALKKTA